MRNWLADILLLLADSATEHPLLIGSVLLLAFVSTAVHVVTFMGHLVLGLSPHFRRQAADLKDMAFLYKEEWRSWRQIFEIARVRAMPAAEIQAELKRQQINATETTRVVEAVVAQVVARLRDEAQMTSGLDYSDVAAPIANDKKHDGGAA